MADDDQIKAVQAALNPKPPRTSSTIMSERERTHGHFTENARISQDLKNYIYTRSVAIPALAVHREALDMICVKMSRILSGQAEFRDHWDDIAGYARLASMACQAPSQSSS